MNELNRRAEELLKKPYHVIDFLPVQVPKDSPGRFFTVENYILNNYEKYGLKDRFERFILRLMCYCRVIVKWGEWIEQPSPQLVGQILDKIMGNHSGWMDMLIPDKNALLQYEWDCMNLTIYNADEELAELIELIARAEGLFCRKYE